MKAVGRNAENEKVLINLGPGFCFCSSYFYTEAISFRERRVAGIIIIIIIFIPGP